MKLHPLYLNGQTKTKRGTPMDYNKAIQLLSGAAHGGSFTYDQDFKDALIMAINALIFRRNLEDAIPYINPEQK